MRLGFRYRGKLVLIMCKDTEYSNLKYFEDCWILLPVVYLNSDYSRESYYRRVDKNGIMYCTFKNYNLF